MFGVGWTEMLVLGVVALIVIGPKDLPVLMNRMGKMVSTVRRMGTEFQREINRASGLDQVHDLRKSITEPLKQTAAQIREEFNKPLAGGGVAPSGAIVPKDPKAESVVDEIHEKLGMPAKQPYIPFTKEAQEKYRREQLAEAATPAASNPAAPVLESPAPPEATVPLVKKARAPRKPKVAAAAEQATAVTEPEAVKKPRKPRAPKPVPEA